MVKKQENKKRCAWVSNDPTDIHYHDHEWGVPVYDDRLLFEFLILEGAQAGLSWLTILKKRDNYRAAFDNFNPIKIARYSPSKLAKLLLNPGIIRNRLKIKSTVLNAKAYLQILKEYKSFSSYLWQFVAYDSVKKVRKPVKNFPTRSVISDTLSKDLKKRGFKFVGTTICYAFMQAVGMVNDHAKNCFRHKEIYRLHD